MFDGCKASFPLTVIEATSCVVSVGGTVLLVRSGSLDLMGGLNGDSFAEGVEGADPEVGIVNMVV